MMTEAIRVENLSKVFYNKKGPIGQREIWALKNASFNVAGGEIFGLLGPNGAGKTTAIRCIAGILRPATGTAYIFGDNINRDVDAHLLREKMGFLTENHGNYENLTMFENLNFFGSFYKIRDLDERINEVLKEIGLYKRKDMKAGKLSKGQKQRLAIARAILHDPRILFFDEPTSGLDPVAAVKVRELILGLKSQDRTIFINSHNLEEVQKVCDRVAILDLGMIKRIGTPAELGKELWETQEMVCKLRDPVSSKIKQSLESLSYIKGIRIENNIIYVNSENADESTPKVIKEIVNLDGNIIEVRRTVHSLEDIYLKLMDEREIKQEGKENGFQK
jgi:ABC-2 type transport system ATP-binding protein